MNEFKGFPERMFFTPIPNLVFSAVAGQITDIVELKVLLHIFEILYSKKGHIRFITATELAGHPSLVQDLKDITIEKLDRPLTALVEKNVLLGLPVNIQKAPRTLYFINNSNNRDILEKIRNSEISLAEFQADPLPIPVAVGTPDIYTLYEENVGLITPLIADELKEAATNYAEAWIREAIKEAVTQNKRNWKYISRILERWATEGKKDGAYRRNPKKNTDPDKYIRGKYGHLVQRGPGD